MHHDSLPIARGVAGQRAAVFLSLAAWESVVPGSEADSRLANLESRTIDRLDCLRGSYGPKLSNCGPKRFCVTKVSACGLAQSLYDHGKRNNKGCISTQHSSLKPRQPPGLQGSPTIVPAHLKYNTRPLKLLNVRLIGSGVQALWFGSIPIAYRDSPNASSKLIHLR